MLGCLYNWQAKCDSVLLRAVLEYVCMCCACMHICMHVYMHVLIYVHVYTCIHVYVCMFVCMYVCMYVYTDHNYQITEVVITSLSYSVPSTL